MSTQYSAVFGYGFVIGPDDLDTVAKKFVDVEDYTEMDEFLYSSGDFLEGYVERTGLKMKMSFNLSWADCKSYLVGVNFVKDFEPWGGSTPQVTPATTMQWEALKNMVEDLGLPSDTYIGWVYGLTVG